MRFALTALLAALAAPASETELGAIQKAALERISQMRFIWIKYRVHEFMSKEYLKDMSPVRPPDAPPAAPVTCSDLRFTVEAEYVRKGDLARTEFAGPSVEDGQLKAAKTSYVSVFNGRRTVSRNGSRGYSINSRPDAVVGYADPWDLCGDRLLVKRFQNFKENKVSLVSAEFSPGPTPDVRQLDLSFSSKWRNTLWLLPESGHCLRRFDTLDETGSHVASYHDMAYDAADGVLYPTGAILTKYKRQDGAVIVYQESRLEVVSITTKRRDIPNTLFEMDIPGDAMIYDEDQGKYLRNPERVQKVLDEIAKESPRRREPRLLGWVAVIGAAALAGTGWWVWRRRGRGKSKQM
jgi:hypothetical protein